MITETIQRRSPAVELVTPKTMHEIGKNILDSVRIKERVLRDAVRFNAENCENMDVGYCENYSKIGECNAQPGRWCGDPGQCQRYKEGGNR